MLNNIQIYHRLSGVLFLIGLLTSCCSNNTSSSSNENEDQKYYDPIECFNRKMFNFNYDIIDNYILRPVAITWNNYIPMPARNGLVNFFTNLEEPVSMMNNFLCLNIYEGIKNFNRFFLNSVFGVAGFIDIASIANAKLAKEELKRFGNTLGYYNISYGPYIVLPFYGSFTLREDGGNWIDRFYPMLCYLNCWMSLAKWLLEGIEKRARLLPFDGILQNSFDPYSLIREAYFQHKDFQARKVDIESEPFNSIIIQNNIDTID